MGIFLEERYSKIADECFGMGWKTLISEDLRIGTFLMDSNEKRVCLDDNITGLLGINKNVSFDEMTQIIVDMTGSVCQNSALKLITIETSEPGITVGFVSYGATTNREHLPMNVYSDMKKFFDLIENNRFRYAFQPIVSAYDGSIVAYEALMRTEDKIGFNPFQILQFATQYKRLYDIEKHTIFNTFKYIKEHEELFEDRRLFINTVPGHFLNDEDFEILAGLVGDVSKKAVIEVTEQTEISDEELTTIKARLKRLGLELAIDDYGTGYSNTSNLLRYNPKIVKIDRSLLTNIDTNSTARSVVGSTIEFLHKAGFVALAEGVETTQELRTVIELGADLIQGYYVAKPALEPLLETPKEPLADIIKYNEERSDIYKRLYYPEDGEVVMLSQLSLDRYTGIILESGKYRIEGIVTQTYSMPIIIKDESKCELTLCDARISSVDETPGICVGNNCSLELTIQGANAILNKGIYVPCGSYFTLLGDGDLAVKAEELNGFGIGSASDASFGTIRLASTREVVVTVNGETAVGIGGGHSGENSRIIVEGGHFVINCSGREIVGMGCFSGEANVIVNDADIDMKLASPSSVGMGIIKGHTEISLNNYTLTVAIAGIESTAVGGGELTSGNIKFAKGHLSINSQGEDLVGVGTRRGDLNCSLANSQIMISCQGAKITAFGDREGDGEIRIVDSGYDVDIISEDPMVIAAKEGKSYVASTAQVSRVR